MSAAGLLWRGLFLLLAAALLAGGFVLARSASWRSDAIAQLEMDADLIEVEDRLIQVAVRGSGSPVLVIHGAPGGYDQALAVAEACGIEEAMIIAPSRPGYLGTPLGTRLLPRQQAEELVALLDELEVPRTAVLAFSSGVPVALALALSHPDRVSALVVVSGVPGPLRHRTADEPPVLPEGILQKLTGDVGAWWASRSLDRNPAQFLEDSLALLTAPPHAGMAEEILSNPGQAEIFESLSRSVLPLSPRELGTRNDMIQLKGMGPLPVKQLKIPVLVVHGTADPFIPVEEARSLASEIPGAVFLPVQKSGHLVWLGQDAPRAISAIQQFLQSAGNSDTPSAPPVENSDEDP